MRKYRTIIVIVVLIGLIASAIYFSVKLFKPKNAGIKIETVPAASVFINDEQVGRTPYKETLKPGEITVKLIPESFDKPLAPYETKVSLASEIETVIVRNFAETEDTSSGEIVSYERVGGGAVELAVVSIPDGAQVSVDGSVRGFVPYKTSSITPGDHQVVIASPGYFERSFTLRAVKGYKLTAVVKLAPSGEVQGEETKEPEEVKIEEIEILSTPTGFLRVRSGPSTSNEEVAQVTPGKLYPLLETDEESGWFKIEYEEGKEGWVSDQYAKKADGEASTTPTPTLKPTPTSTPVKTPTPTPSLTPTGQLTPTPIPTPSI